jgi:hypothetical protein
MQVEKQSQWISAVLVVYFDLEIGQKIEVGAAKTIFSLFFVFFVFFVF